MQTLDTNIQHSMLLLLSLLAADFQKCSWNASMLVCHSCIMQRSKAYRLE
jgi:hypothetical protein